jgi:hypothetical protein
LLYSCTGAKPVGVGIIGFPLAPNAGAGGAGGAAGGGAAGEFAEPVAPVAPVWLETALDVGAFAAAGLLTVPLARVVPLSAGSSASATTRGVVPAGAEPILRNETLTRELALTGLTRTVNGRRPIASMSFRLARCVLGSTFAGRCSGPIATVTDGAAAGPAATVTLRS